MLRPKFGLRPKFSQTHRLLEIPNAKLLCFVLKHYSLTFAKTKYKPGFFILAKCRSERS